MAVQKKKKARRSSPRRKTRKNQAGLSVRSLVTWLVTLSFLVFSLGVLGYVVFFRTVQAAEIPKETLSEDKLVFEEPEPPGHMGVVEPEKQQQNNPVMAIIIDDMGYHERVGHALLELPYELTFSFLPYAPFTKELSDQAYQLDKTILLHLPMQPKSKEWNPGGGALLIESSPEEQTRLLESNLALVPYATGLNNHMGSLYTEKEELMETLLSKIKEKELFFVDSFTTADSVGYKIAQSLGVKTARRHVFLDNVHDVDKICTQLSKLVQLAEEHGEAIGIGHPSQETYEALKTCIPQYSDRVDIVAVSSLVR